MTAIWAHRGVSNKAPENTLTAFQLAHEIGADGVELDVQLSADRQVMVIHDLTVDRTTNASGRVSGFSAAELQQLDAGDGAGIPTLEEVYALLKPTSLVINVELKNGCEPYSGLEEQVLSVTAAADMINRVRFSSFNHYSMAKIRQLDPEAAIGLLYDAKLWRPWRYAQTFSGDTALHPHHSCLFEPGLVEQCRTAGTPINCWTVDCDDHLWRWLALDVDAVITNEPELALELRRGFSGD